MELLEGILFGNTSKKLHGLIAFVLAIVLCFIYTGIPFGITLLGLLIINTFIVISLVKNKKGLIPCARYLFLVTPGLLQSIVWYFSEGAISVALLANSYLNKEIVIFVAVISTLAAASSNIGFLLKPIIIQMIIPRPNLSGNFSIIFYILFIIVALYYGYSLGGSLVGSDGYAGGDTSRLKTIGTLNVFYFYFFSLFFIYKFWMKPYSELEVKFFFLITFLVVGFIALRGVRQDSIGFLLAVLAVLMGKKYVKYKKPLYFFVLFLFAFSWIGSIFTGVFRESLSLSTLLTIVQSPLSFFIILTSDMTVVFNMNTASMTIGTLNVIPYKLLDTGYLFGKSFLDWIPRTFPEFIYPGRPEGPEFAMHYNGDWFGWGGIHEVAECYWNFGYLGVVFLPCLFSCILNSLGKSFMRSYSFFAAIPMVWLIMMPRWIWYQIFALYKSTLVMILVCYLLQFLIPSKNEVVKD